jgi:putative iron-dependent peroxidase
MTTPQPGIFALGASSQTYLEFDVVADSGPVDLVSAVANLRQPRTTMAGVNLVSGFRPELWRSVLPDGLPATLTGFNTEIIGPRGTRLPSTQHDLVVWLSGGANDVVFDEARQVIQSLAQVAGLSAETTGWTYDRDRDLTGFIDGSENPDLLEAPKVALVPEGTPGAGGSVLLLQRWAHDAARWESLPVAEQERVIGRRKSDSVELSPRPADSHVTRTDQDKFGKIFRRNVPYGTVADHGTMFVGFAAHQDPLLEMLRSMVGIPDGIPDRLTEYTRALTGAFYFVPALEDLRRFATAPGAG